MRQKRPGSMKGAVSVRYDLCERCEGRAASPTIRQRMLKGSLATDRQQEAYAASPTIRQRMLKENTLFRIRTPSRNREPYDPPEDAESEQRVKDIEQGKAREPYDPPEDAERPSGMARSGGLTAASPTIRQRMLKARAAMPDGGLTCDREPYDPPEDAERPQYLVILSQVPKPRALRSARGC